MVGELIVMTKQEFVSMLREELARLGIGGQHEPQTVTRASLQHELMHTRTVKKVLKEKGYRAQWHTSFKNVLTEHKIKAVKKGKDNWYKRVDIERIPPKG